jgi:hypothetical protein
MLVRIRHAAHAWADIVPWSAVTYPVFRNLKSQSREDYNMPSPAKAPTEMDHSTSLTTEPQAFEVHLDMV